MNSKFSPMDYALNKEYRQRQMQRSLHTRQVDELNEHAKENEDMPSSQLISANILSALLILVSIIVLIIFFTMGTSESHAQSNILLDSGSDGMGGSEVHYYLAKSIEAIHLGNLESASLILDEALRIEPNFAALYMTQSYIHLISESTEDALTFAETARDITPDDAAVYFLLAEAQFAQGNYTEAQGNYEHYLDMVYANDYQPILITALLDDDSLLIVQEHLAACIEETTI